MKVDRQASSRKQKSSEMLNKPGENSQKVNLSFNLKHSVRLFWTDWRIEFLNHPKNKNKNETNETAVEI